MHDVNFENPTAELSVRKAASAPLRILLVEDNPGDSELIILLLHESGYPCDLRLATDGVEAMDTIHALVKKKRLLPEVIILDLNLPRKDGREVLKELKIDARTRSIPVIVLTTSDRPEDINWSRHYEVEAFLTKPNDLPGYESMVHKFTTVDLPRLQQRRDV